MEKTQEWVDITDILTDKEIKKYAVEIEFAVDKFSDVRRVPHGKRSFKTMVRANFIPQFKSYLYGKDGISVPDMSRMYGIDMHTIYNAGRKKGYDYMIVGDNPRTAKILHPRLYMALTELEPQEPFSDKQWITGRQLRDMFLGDFQDDSIEIVNLLRKFAAKHPGAVAGYFDPSITYGNDGTVRLLNQFDSNMMSRVELSFNPFDPIRLKRKYLNEFKETFELSSVHERELMPHRTLVRKIKTKEDLRDLVLGFERMFRGATGPDKLTDELTVQKSFFPLFQQYVEQQDEFQSILDLAKNTLISHEISELVENRYKNTPSRVEKKMIDFAKQNPDAVIIRRSGLIGLRKEYLDEFLKFTGMTLWQKTELSVQQLEIDPAAPGYQTDPDLNPIDDKKMDAVAWRLAGKKVKTAAVADDMIFAEWAKRKGRKGKL